MLQISFQQKLIVQSVGLSLVLVTAALFAFQWAVKSTVVENIEEDFSKTVQMLNNTIDRRSKKLDEDALSIAKNQVVLNLIETTNMRHGRLSGSHYWLPLT